MGEGTDKFKIVLFAKIHSFSLSMPALLTALFFNQLLVLIPYFFLKERKPLSQYTSAHEHKYSSVLPVFFLLLALPLSVFPILSTSLSLLLSRGYSKERLLQEAFSVPATPSCPSFLPCLAHLLCGLDTLVLLLINTASSFRFGLRLPPPGSLPGLYRLNP